MICIAYAREDGRVSVVHPAPAPDGVAEADWLNTVRQRAVPQGVPWRLMRVDELPTYDSATRDRWRWSNGQIVLTEPDPEPPRVVQLDRIGMLEAKVNALLESIRAGAEGRT